MPKEARRLQNARKSQQKPVHSTTIRTRTDDKPQAFDAATRDDLVQTACEVPAEKLELLRPDGRFALHRDGPGTLRDRAGGARESGAGDIGPDRLDLREQAGGTGAGKGRIEGAAEGTRGEAPHAKASASPWPSGRLMARSRPHLRQLALAAQSSALRPHQLGLLHPRHVLRL